MHGVGGLRPNQLSSVVGQVVNGVCARGGGRVAVTTVVVAQHRVAILKCGGHAVPHGQVASHGVAQYDHGTLALFYEMKLLHVYIPAC